MNTSLQDLVFQPDDTSTCYHVEEFSYFSMKKGDSSNQDTIFWLIDTMTRSTYSREKKFKEASRGYLVEWARSTPFQLLNTKYKDQKVQNADFVKEHIKDSDIAFRIVANDLLELFKSIDVSITNTPSLSFRIRNFQNHDISYEVFVDDAELFVAYSIYKNKELSARNMGSHSEMLAEVVEILRLFPESTQPRFEDPMNLERTY